MLVLADRTDHFLNYLRIVRKSLHNVYCKRVRPEATMPLRAHVQHTSIRTSGTVRNT